MDWYSALAYDAGATTWTATIPSRPPAHRRAWVGGSLEVASGLRESYTIRTDRVLVWTFRVRESELPAFLLAVDHAVANPGDVTFYPNGTSAAGYAVYLLSPTHGEDFEPQRTDVVTADGAVFECALTFRKVDGTAWALNYYAP